MKNFEQWFSEQGLEETEEIDDTVYLTCTGCGKQEYLSRDSLENGDEWATFDYEQETGLCGSGPYCTP